MKKKVSLYYNQITIGLKSVKISDVIVYIPETHSTSSSLKKKKRHKAKEKERMKREKERKEVEKMRRRKMDGKSLCGRKGKRGE